MKNMMVVGSLRYKDRGQIEYRIIEGFDGEQDCLVLHYKDPEKQYTWEYFFFEDGMSALQHVQNVSYEALKQGFVENLAHSGYYLHKGEYQLLKEAIVIFVSHKEYIVDVCRSQGLGEEE
jgi:hypothetical protein